MDLCVCCGKLTGLKLAIGRILALGNGHRAHTSVQCPRSSCQLGGTHRPHHRVLLRIEECLDDDLAIGRWVIVMCGEAE